MIELIDICYTVGNKQILNNINLKLTKGLNILIGENGAGKSTLAKIIMGIVKPTSGKIYYNSEDITNFTIDQRARLLGFSYAFQQPVRFKGISVSHMLSFAHNNIASKEQLLADVGLDAEQYLNRDIDANLSGGEIKRIELATAFANYQNVNIYDEPEAGIDMWTFDKLTKKLKSLYKHKKSIVIIITHNKKVIKLATRNIYIENGKIK